MIPELIAALNELDIDLSDEEIADAFWLASVIKETSQSESQTDSKDYSQSNKPDEETPEQQDEDRLNPSPISSTARLYHGVRIQSQRIGISSLIPFRSPAATALPGLLKLERSLRPLMRKVTSRTLYKLDEEATVKRIADEKLWLPVLKPTQSRWLELALIVDQSSSMVIWKRTIAELQSMLERHGAFRKVRVWKLVTDTTDGKIGLLIKSSEGSEKLTVGREEELVDPTGRCLVLVVSDCVAPTWHIGEVARWLEPLSRACPVSILQVLPYRLWNRTALGKVLEVWLRAKAPGVPNSHLQIEFNDPKLIQKSLSRKLAIPVTTLEPEPFLLWSRMIAGLENSETRGVLLDLDQTVFDIVVSENSVSVNDSKEKISESKETSNAAYLIKRFRTNASPLARKLAGLLAAAPVLTLPIIRLVYNTLLPQAELGHVAEVFLSGLLVEYNSSDINIARNSDKIQLTVHKLCGSSLTIC